jgi:tetratricopeptide (TPR) repeat protein
MKRIILAAAGVGALIGLGFFINRSTAPAIGPAESTAESVPDRQTDEAPATKYAAAKPDSINHRTPRSDEDKGKLEADIPTPAATTAAAPRELQLVLDQAIESLLAPQTGFEQKQTTWKELKKAGKLDQAISELERRAGADQTSADTIAALGQAYWQKCSAIDDIREKAILIMKADQAFDAALNLDPANWEARYTKALAMSYWPAELNKGNAVVEQFSTLIQQQESQSPQPQFARSYLRLGDQYEKLGHPDYARQTWQRGAAFFPDDADLRKKLAEASAAQ